MPHFSSETVHQLDFAKRAYQVAEITSTMDRVVSLDNLTMAIDVLQTELIKIRALRESMLNVPRPEPAVIPHQTINPNEPIVLHCLSNISVLRADDEGTVWIYSIDGKVSAAAGFYHLDGATIHAALKERS